jgi:CHAT domain
MPGASPVLIVFANPRGTSALRLGEEDRAITESVRRSRHRDDIELTKCHAATVHDLSRALLDEAFRIVHISGHGTHSGLVLEESDGSRFVVPQAALAKTFSAYASPNGHLDCVILNACYSVSTGTLASLGVPYTIAMEGPISDRAAVEFSRGFYDAIGAGKDIPFAYEEGCRRVELAAPGTQFVSRLLRLGESYDAPPVDPAGNGGRVSGTTTPVLVGLGVDLSGSMRANMRNNSGDAMTRLEGFRRSLQRTIESINKDLGQYRDGETPNFDLFAYGFGLRHRTVPFADLFSLIKLGRDVISPEEIERLTEKHSSAVRRQYEAKAAQYGGVADIARRYLGSYVDQVERNYRAEAEAEVRNRVLAEVADRVASRLRTLGDTTLSIEEVVHLWNQSGRAFEEAEELIFGSTPMCVRVARNERAFRP